MNLVQALRVKHDLHQTRRIAKVDEHYAAVISARVDPSTNRHCLTNPSFSDF
jgi:hypothetical protein